MTLRHLSSVITVHTGPRVKGDTERVVFRTDGVVKDRKPLTEPEPGLKWSTQTFELSH